MVAKLPAPETVAVKVCAPPAGTEAAAGATLTCKPSVTVTTADALLCGDEALAAVMVTFAGLGKLAGAVYKPAADMVPTERLPPLTLFTLQLTAELVAPVTLATNC